MQRFACPRRHGKVGAAAQSAKMSDFSLSADARPNQRSMRLDAVRGVAIAMILLFHLFSGPLAAYSLRVSYFAGCLWSGVDLFFCLSGYLIGGIILDNIQSPNFYRTFYARRALRIFPLYALCVVGYFIVIQSFRDFLTYATFTQNFEMASTGLMGTWVGVTWSLAIEEQFYLILPAIVRFTPPSRLPWVCVAMIASAPLARLLAYWAYGDKIAVYVLLPCRMDALFAGVLVAWLVRDGRALAWVKRRRAAAILGLGALWLGTALLFRADATPFSDRMQEYGYTWTALTFAASLFAVVSSPATPTAARAFKPLAQIGVGAYSMYLFHYPILLVFQRAIADPMIASLVALAAILAFSFLLWRAVEAPLLEIGKRRFRYDLARQARFAPQEVPIAASALTRPSV